MDAVLTLLVVLAVVITIGVLLLGVASMARGGSFDDTQSHRLMAGRVYAQGAAILLLALLALTQLG